MADNSTLVTLGESDTGLALALVFGFMLLGLGLRNKVFWIVGGPCWILMGIAIFNSYDPAFMFMSVGLGFTLLFMGAYDALR